MSVTSSSVFAISDLLDVDLPDVVRLRRVSGGGRVVRQHVGCHRGVHRYGQVRIHEGHRLAVRQLFAALRLELFLRQLSLWLLLLDLADFLCHRSASFVSVYSDPSESVSTIVLPPRWMIRFCDLLLTCSELPRSPSLPATTALMPPETFSPGRRMLIGLLTIFLKPISLTHTKF